jgi:predicted O-linked N-acetylglucosamine transferase (SPINDLY family)
MTEVTLTLPEAIMRAAAAYACGRFSEADRLARAILDVKADCFDALHLIAVLESRQGRYAEALASYDRALAVQPDHSEVLNNRGNALQELKRFDEALASYEKALLIKPDYADAPNNHGKVLGTLHRYQDALASYEKALAITPHYAEALNNRGNVLGNLHRLQDALANYDKALAIKPDYADALINRGSVLSILNRHDNAIADFEDALKINPDLGYAKGQLLHSKMQCCNWTAFESELGRLKNDIKHKKGTVSPFVLLALTDSPSEQLSCAQTRVREKSPSPPTPIWKGERYHHDRIRLAYLSADFHDHPVSHLLAGLFEQHDKAYFEVFAVSFGPDNPSKMRFRLREAFDQFIDVRTKSDYAVANLLRHLEVDIAVDLMGFTLGARFGIFALRPAPVQVNYLGYPGTTGSECIDYIIADKFVIPAEQRVYYTEKVAYLPDTYQANCSRRISQRIPTRRDVHLPEKAFVFCSFNKSYKITPTVFDLWMRLLRAVEGSVLWLLGTNSAVERNLRHEAQARGIEPSRLIFAPRIKYCDYLARYQLADLFLDTLPFNGGTTASDALWVGLPLVTCEGEAFAARMAGSLLRAVGLPELVTRSFNDYEALALKLALNNKWLSDIKTRLRANRETFPLFDTDRFRCNIEACYKAMWERYQRGEPPKSFAVTL